MGNVDYEAISFLLRGKRRRKVLESIKEGTKTPKQISRSCEISISNVSLAVSELLEKGLIRCENPEAHTYKFFEITEKGKKILDSLKDYEKDV